MRGLHHSIPFATPVAVFIPRLPSRALVVAALALLVSASTARGQGNPQSQVLGGRSALMGGTGVALGSDSAAPFLNPAGLARINQSTLALSSQLIELEVRTLSRFRQPGPAPDLSDGVTLEDADVTNIALDFIPTAVCYFQSLGETDSPRKHTLSFCLGATEEDEVTSLGQSGSIRADGFQIDATNSVDATWTRRAFGFGWGHFFTDWLAGGASVFVDQAEQKVTLSTTGLREDLAAELSDVNALNLNRTGTSFALRGEVGGLVHLGDRLRVGLAVRTPSWVFASSYNETQERRSIDGSTRRRVETGSFEAPSAGRIALGLGYEGPRLQVELDMFFYIPRADFLSLEVDREETRVEPDGSTSRTRSTETVDDGSNFTVNISAGARYSLSPSWSVLAGFQTDLSLLEDRADRAPEDRIASTSADLFFGSVGVGYKGRLGNIVTGLRGGYRDGQVVTVDSFVFEPTTAVVTDTAVSVLFVIYGELDFGAVAKELTPKFLQKESEPVSTSSFTEGYNRT